MGVNYSTKKKFARYLIKPLSNNLLEEMSRLEIKYIVVYNTAVLCVFVIIWNMDCGGGGGGGIDERRNIVARMRTLV